MKKLSSILVLLFAISVHSTAQKQKVILNEDFSSNKNNWLTYIGKVATYLVYNGKYVFATNDSVSTYNVTMPDSIDVNKDFSITVTATHTDGTDNYGYGLFFGASDINNYYCFYITNNGYYRISKSNTTSGYSELVKWTTSPAIKSGDYVDNILEFSKQGTNWIITINGQLITTIPALPLFGNKIGFSQTNYQRVEYDDVKVVED